LFVPAAPVIRNVLYPRIRPTTDWSMSTVSTLSMVISSVLREMKMRDEITHLVPTANSVIQRVNQAWAKAATNDAPNTTVLMAMDRLLQHPIDRTRPSPAGRPMRSMLSTWRRKNWRRNQTQNPPWPSRHSVPKTGTTSAKRAN
jgi:hypothetical protein